MFFKKLKFISQSGYSLIELTAVIAIIVVMALVAVTSYVGTKKSTVLDKAVRQVVLDLRRAQNMAMNTAKFNNEIPQGGYGVNFVSGSLTYILYADCNNNQQYNSSASCAGGTATEKISDVSIDSQVKISQIKIGNSFPPSAVTSPVGINFIPPNPNVKINNFSNYYANITIQYGTGISKIISINGLTGQISVN